VRHGEEVNFGFEPDTTPFTRELTAAISQADRRTRLPTGLAAYLSDRPGCTLMPRSVLNVADRLAEDCASPDGGKPCCGKAAP
jgi:hypothetical protein